MSDSTFGILFFSQAALLVIYYGLNINLPWWVVWFPALFAVGSAILAGIIVVAFLVIKVVFE